MEKLTYDNNSQDVKLIPNTPIIARKNCKEFDIFNNEMFVIKKIVYEEELIIINANDDENKNVNIPFQMFQRLFYVSYAITIYKSQGSTFDFG